MKYICRALWGKRAGEKLGFSLYCTKIFYYSTSCFTIYSWLGGMLYTNTIGSACVNVLTFEREKNICIKLMLDIQYQIESFLDIMYMEAMSALRMYGASSE